MATPLQTTPLQVNKTTAVKAEEKKTGFETVKVQLTPENVAKAFKAGQISISQAGALLNQIKQKSAPSREVVVSPVQIMERDIIARATGTAPINTPKEVSRSYSKGKIGFGEAVVRSQMIAQNEDLQKKANIQAGAKQALQSYQPQNQILGEKSMIKPVIITPPATVPYKPQPPYILKQEKPNFERNYVKEGVLSARGIYETGQSFVYEKVLKPVGIGDTSWISEEERKGRVQSSEIKQIVSEYEGKSGAKAFIARTTGKYFEWGSKQGSQIVFEGERGAREQAQRPFDIALMLGVGGVAGYTAKAITYGSTIGKAGVITLGSIGAGLYGGSIIAQGIINPKEFPRFLGGEVVRSSAFIGGLKIGESLYKPPQPKILSYQVGESKRIADQQQFYDVTEYKAVAKVGEQNFEIKGIGSEKGVLIQGDKGAYVLRGKQVYLISSDQAKSLTLGDVTSRGIGGQKGAFRVEKLEIFSSKGELKSYQLVDISQVRPALEVGGLKSQFVYGEKYAVQKGSFLDISDVYSGMTTERFQYQVNGVTYTEFQQAYGGVSGKKGISELFKDFTVNFHKRGSFESISDLTPKKIENFGWLGKTPKSTGGIGVSKTDLGGVSVSGVKSTGALQRSMSTGKFIVSTIAEARSKGMIPSFELSALGAKQVLSTDFGIKPKQISPIEVSFMLKEKPKIDFGIFDIQKPIIESKPIIENKPIVDTKPILEMKPVIETKPKIEQRSFIEQRSLIEQTPILEQTPLLETRGFAPVSIVTYPVPPVTTIAPPVFPFGGADRDFKRSFKRGFGGIKNKSLLFDILPDLRSVSFTEAITGREATIPRSTKKVRGLFLSALKGYSTGFVPTEEIRTGKVRNIGFDIFGGKKRKKKGKSGLYGFNLNLKGLGFGKNAYKRLKL